MPFIQNISEEQQLVRIQDVKRVLNPGEIAEVTEKEISVCKSYKRLFKEVKTAEGVKTPEGTGDTGKDPYEGLTQAELKSIAKEREIDITGIKKNIDIIAKLKEYDEAKKLEDEKKENEEDGKSNDETKTPEGTGDITPQ